MITAAQLRAARGLLDWSRHDLAKAANISSETVKNIEHGTFRPQETTADAIVKAFAAHDVQFIEDEGVQKQRDPVKTFKGHEGYRLFLDHIYLMLKSGGIIRQFNESDRVLTFADDYSRVHLERMTHVPNLDARVIVQEGDYNFPAPYCEYRWMHKDHVTSIPFYIYNNYVSMASYKDENNIEITSIHSEFMATKFVTHFDRLWVNSTIPPKKRDK